MQNPVPFPWQLCQGSGSSAKFLLTVFNRTREMNFNNYNIFIVDVNVIRLSFPWFGHSSILNWIVRVAIYCNITAACSFICWNRCTNYTVVLTKVALP